MTIDTSSGTSETQSAGLAATAQASSGATPQTPTLTLEDALKRIAELEHAHKNAREQADRQAKTLSKYEKEKQDAELAKLGDLEKAQARAEQAEKQIQQYQEQLVHAEIRIAAQGKGIINPDLIADTIFKQLTFEDGKPSNLDKALDELIKSNPYLIKQAEGQTPAQTGAPRVPVGNPGRSNIVEPGTLSPGRTVSWNDFYTSKRR